VVSGMKNCDPLSIFFFRNLASMEEYSKAARLCERLFLIVELKPKEYKQVPSNDSI